MADSGDERVGRAIAGVERLYTGNLAEHGIDSRSVGWPDRESQLLRFDKLSYLIELERPRGPVTVNDWGCGYGAMLTYLDERGDVEVERYHGYDLSADMLAAAAEHAGDDPRVELVEGSEVTREADFSFVSGTFNVRMDASDADWDAYVKDKLREIASCSRRGFAFNLLTSYVDWRKDDLFYADPAEYFGFCKRELGRRVTLLHDYPLYEWTIVVLGDTG